MSQFQYLENKKFTLFIAKFTRLPHSSNGCSIENDLNVIIIILIALLEIIVMYF